MHNNSPTRLVDFSSEALINNLAALFREQPEVAIDLRCDAYGYGGEWVENHAREVGFTRFIDPEDIGADTPRSTQFMYGIDGGHTVARLHGEIVATKTIDAGDSVSYGYTWTATEPTQLALVSLGFADGLPRGGSNRCSMTVSGQRVPLVGRIAMDQCVIDVTGVDAVVGSLATTWDTEASVTQWATVSGRTPLSLVAKLGWRVRREWLS